MAEQQKLRVDRRGSKAIDKWKTIVFILALLSLGCGLGIVIFGLVSPQAFVLYSSAITLIMSGLGLLFVRSLLEALRSITESAEIYKEIQRKEYLFLDLENDKVF